MDGRPVSRVRVLAPVAVLCSLVLGACDAATPRTMSRSPSAAVPSAVTPPKAVTAQRLGPAAGGGVRPGTPVSAGFTGIRVFINRRNGFALTGLPDAGGGTYPVASTDGGKTWRTDGPVLQIPAAQGAAAVGQAGVAAPRIYFAWCAACNNLIDLTPDAGKHWWAARLPGQILSLTGTPHTHAGLVAIVEGPTADPRGRGASLWEYISTNGRRWTYAYSLSAVS